MISVPEAQQRILGSAESLDNHTIPVEKALSHVLARDILADRPIPPFNRVAMDGYAVRSSDFTTTTVRLKTKGKIQTGVASGLKVNSGEAVQIMTGAPAPDGADAVVKVENSEIDADWVILTEEKMKPGLNIAPMGEDAAEGKLLIAGGTPLTTAGIAVCASVGVSEVEVYQRPTIKILSTGTEIIPPHRKPLPHQIRDCNSFTLRTMCRDMDLETEFLGIGEDDTQVLGKLIREGLKADILILSGGVSMGEFDHVPKMLSENGVENILHHVKVKPGKPLWFGKSDQGTFVFGLPGNPVSVQSCFRIFVEPLIKKLSGYASPENVFLRLPLAQEVVSKTPREHYMPGVLTIADGRSCIEPVSIRGSGDFSNFERSHGLIKCPPEKTVLEAGSLAEFLPWSELW